MFFSVLTERLAARSTEQSVEMHISTVRGREVISINRPQGVEPGITALAADGTVGVPMASIEPANSVARIHSYSP
jgi:hypothetical protein